MSSKFPSNSSFLACKDLAPKCLFSPPPLPTTALGNKMNSPLLLDDAVHLCPVALPPLHIPSLLQPSSPKSLWVFKTALGTASSRKPSRFLPGGRDRRVPSSLRFFLAPRSSFTGLIVSFQVPWYLCTGLISGTRA